MLTFERQNNKFNFRVAGIAVHNNKILLHTTPEHDYWVLPGGRVEFNESTSDGIVREIQEELGVLSHVERLCYVHELIFTENGNNFHELGFYYLISLPENNEIMNKESEFYGIEDGGRLIFRWFSFDELNQIEVYPEFIKRDIHVLLTSEIIKHEVTNES
ncbi:NUDIX hydrolase [Paenibacillus sp. Soil724D2]|uniref:NUDIX hydrolase n=1 Tax=Paenibacillus sp. (strain Soil724D2) TaxID=1736392 RepID=UPI00071338BE|nr:NUDIX hydrolase [Paenibacillus sp. Soil724D2]KRE52049.1 hypothetical protein ASG85_02665 [Paenibacillus sp. Soil724D2]